LPIRALCPRGGWRCRRGDYSRYAGAQENGTRDQDEHELEVMDIQEQCSPRLPVANTPLSMEDSARAAFRAASFSAFMSVQRGRAEPLPRCTFGHRPVFAQAPPPRQGAHEAVAASRLDTDLGGPGAPVDESVWAAGWFPEFEAASGNVPGGGAVHNTGAAPVALYRFNARPRRGRLALTRPLTVQALATNRAPPATTACGSSAQGGTRSPRSHRVAATQRPWRGCSAGCPRARPQRAPRPAHPCALRRGAAPPPARTLAPRTRASSS
jgi:hypothetical protein